MNESEAFITQLCGTKFQLLQACLPIYSKPTLVVRNVRHNARRARALDNATLRHEVFTKRDSKHSE